MRPTAMFSRGRHFIAHEILKDNANLAVEVFQVVFAKIDAIEQHLPFEWDRKAASAA